MNRSFLDRESVQTAEQEVDHYASSNQRQQGVLERVAQRVDEKKPSFDKVEQASALWAVIVCALNTAGIGLMNNSLFPLFDAVFTYARDISVLSGSCALVLIALAATFKPQFLNIKMLSGVVLFSISVGIAGMVAGLLFDNIAALVIGSMCFSVARSVMLVCLGLFLCMVSAQYLPSVVFGGMALGMAGSLVLPLMLPQWLVAGIFFTFIPLILVIVGSKSLEISTCVLACEAPADIAVTRPSSFVPLSSALFGAIFLFKMGFGFALRIGEQAGTPLFDSVPAIILCAVLALAYGVIKPLLSLDRIVAVAGMIVIAGMLAVGAPGDSDVHQWASTLAYTGSQLFVGAAWLVIVAIAQRSMTGALSVTSWGLCLMGAATTVGAFLGTRLNQLPGEAAFMHFLMMAAGVLFFAAYLSLILPTFSFDRQITQIEPYTEPVTPPELLLDGTEASAVVSMEDISRAFYARCDMVAQSYDLTPRETEVFRLLACGRNRQFIEEELNITRNTVKVHVKHIYQKLDIHSHQELLDTINLVDAPADDSTDQAAV